MHVQKTKQALRDALVQWVKRHLRGVGIYAITPVDGPGPDHNPMLLVTYLGSALVVECVEAGAKCQFTPNADLPRFEGTKIRTLRVSEIEVAVDAIEHALR